MEKELQEETEAILLESRFSIEELKQEQQSAILSTQISSGKFPVEW